MTYLLTPVLRLWCALVGHSTVRVAIGIRPDPAWSGNLLTTHATVCTRCRRTWR